MAPPTIRNVLRGEASLHSQIKNVQNHYADLIERVEKMFNKVGRVKAETDRDASRLPEDLLLQLNKTYKDLMKLWENNAKMEKQWKMEPVIANSSFPQMNKSKKNRFI